MYCAIKKILGNIFRIFFKKQIFSTNIISIDSDNDSCYHHNYRDDSDKSDNNKNDDSHDNDNDNDNNNMCTNQLQTNYQSRNSMS